ncbi:hypothetical protein LCGC14_0338340 [marine sediment metagenome]|uniref:Uncharacterized protein n=1 Tax=marine sediment metagenome TaxID=412755 RepID=A0A0F9TEI3_9ZZZZ
MNEVGEEMSKRKDVGGLLLLAALLIGVMAALLAELGIRVGLAPQIAGIFQGVFIATTIFALHQIVQSDE